MAGIPISSAPGKKSLVLSRLCARYKGTDRGPLGSTSRDLSKFKYDYLQSLTPLKFRACSSKRCKTCPCANDTSIFPNNNVNVFCKVYNCIYRLTCTVCGIAYIGQTSNPLHKRINQHRSDVGKYNPSDSNDHNVEFEHFNLHGFDNISIDILTIIPQTQERIFLESQLIKFHNTCYPYGLNQLIDNKTMQFYPSDHFSNNYKPVYNSLNFTLYPKTQRKKRGGNKNRKVPSPSEIKNILIESQNQFLKEFNWRNLRKFTFSIKKKHLQAYYKVFQSLSINNHFSHIFYDLISARAQKLNANLLEKVKHNENSQIIINFTHPVFNHLNINSVLNQQNNPFPISSVKICKVFKYPRSLGRTIFNYNKFAKFCSDDDSNPCLCNEERFKDYVNQEHGHIITGDLNIVENKKLRNFMILGTKFRLPSNYNSESIILKFIYDLDFFIYKMAIKYNKPIQYFDVWKYHTIKYFKYQLTNLNFSNNYNILSLKKHIKILQKNFIITYVDKAPNNYAIICKQYYKKLLDHFFLDSQMFEKSSNNRTINNRKILNFHKLLNIKCQNFNYPYIVLIPKFHKSPIKFRSVTVGCNAYNNVAGKLLLNFLNQINTLSKGDNKISIKNSYELKKKIHNITNISYIKTYDFKDLFNNIQIPDLHKVIHSLYKEYFLKHKIPIDEAYFKRLLNFILNNNFIVYDKTIYSQISGIPQGGCASSMLANLYLFYYERHYQHDDIIFLRYIDDIILISKKAEIFRNPLNFYPSNLELIENVLTSSNSVNFLDLKLIVHSNGSLNFDLYDKRKDFPFKVNTFSNFKSCLHKSVFRNILLNLRYRIVNLCSSNNILKHLINLEDTALTEQFPFHFVKYHLNRSTFSSTLAF